MTEDMQSLEKGSYNIYFTSKHSELAQALMKRLEEVSEGECSIFGLKVPFIAEFYFIDSDSAFTELTGEEPHENEKVRVFADRYALFFFMERVKEGTVIERAIKELAHFIFDSAAVCGPEPGSAQTLEPEKAVAFEHASWLREGFANHLVYYNKGEEQQMWEELRSQLGSKGLIPRAKMIKGMEYIPNPSRRRIAAIQSFFMVRFLADFKGGNFLADYADLVKKSPNQSFEQVFQSLTGLSCEQFFGMFDICVNNKESF